MAPYSTLARPEEETLAAVEEHAPPPPKVTLKKSLPPLHWDRMLPRKPLLTDSLLELSSTRPNRATADVLASLLLHLMLIATMVLIPLLFTEAIDLRQFTSTLLVAPPPPPPPPPPPAQPLMAKTTALRRVFTSGGKLLAPTVIPGKIAMLKEEALPPDPSDFGVVGGVPGGVPGGQIGGVLGGIIGGSKSTSPVLPPPPPAAPKAPLRVGGRVKSPMPLHTPQPEYPTLARTAKVSGDVLIDAVIDAQGHVVEMKVISGHPLLVPAALQALKNWKYEPTYLNEEPIPVQLLVTVHFRLK